jgi:hypothetical protein
MKLRALAISGVTGWISTPSAPRVTTPFSPHLGLFSRPESISNSMPAPQEVRRGMASNQNPTKFAHAHCPDAQANFGGAPTPDGLRHCAAPSKRKREQANSKSGANKNQTNNIGRCSFV